MIVVFSNTALMLLESKAVLDQGMLDEGRRDQTCCHIEMPLAVCGVDICALRTLGHNILQQLDSHRT